LLEKIHIKWIYIIGLLGIASSIFLGSVNIYFAPAIPLFLLLVYGAIYHSERFLWIIVFLVPLSVLANDIGLGVGMSLPTEPFIFMFFTLMVLKMITSGKMPAGILKHPLSLFILINTLWMMVTVFTSVDQMVSLKYFLSRSWYVGVFYFTAVYLFRKMKNLEYFLWAMLAGFIVLVCYTTARHAMEGFVMSHNFLIMRPFYPDHGMYAASIAFVVPMAAIFSFKGNWLGLNNFHRLMLLIAFVLLLYGIVFSFTRATWVSLAGAGGVYLLMFLRIRFKTIILSLVMGGIFFGAFQDQIFYLLSGNKQGSVSNFEGHIQSISNISTDPSNLERINRWKSAVRMYIDEPIFGFGPGTYVNNYGAYQSTEDLTVISTFSGDLGNAHSEYFSALTETGTIGFVTWLGIFLLSIAYGFKLYYKSPNRKVRIYALSATLGLMTYYLHGFLNNYSDFDKIAVPLWGYIAVIAALELFHADYDKKSLTSTEE
jgi:putative inorganic carbon (HCO3(-)) transporter